MESQLLSVISKALRGLALAHHAPVTLAFLFPPRAKVLAAWHLLLLPPRPLFFRNLTQSLHQIQLNLSDVSSAQQYLSDPCHAMATLPVITLLHFLHNVCHCVITPLFLFACDCLSPSTRT